MQMSLFDGHKHDFIIIDEYNEDQKIKLKKFAERYKSDLLPREMNGMTVITCPECRNVGTIGDNECWVCKRKRFVNPKKIIEKVDNLKL